MSKSWVGIYFVVAHDAQRREYLVVAVSVDGPADVIGRFDDLAGAERDAGRWTALEAGAA